MASKRARRRRRGKHQARNANIDRMNRALGEFLTAQGRVELTMVLLLMLIRDEDYEWLFDEMSKRTFQQKIEFFKLYTGDDEQFTPENRILRDQIYKDLDELLPKRNSIVHGETYEHQFDGRPKQPYRLGVIKKNIKYIEDFTMDKHGPNVFTVRGVKEATGLGDRIWRNINKIRGVGQSPWD